MKSLFPIVCGLAIWSLFNFSCAAGKQKSELPKSSVKPSVTTKLLDMFVINDKYIVPNHPGFLQRNSKAWGADIKLAGKKFTVGFVDYNGDGHIDAAGKDLIIATIFRNRSISINNEYGTHRIPVKDKKHFLQVDSTVFSITLPGDDKMITVTVAAKPEEAKGEKLKIITRVPVIDLTSMDDNTINLDKYLGRQKMTLIFFWNLRPFPETTENNSQVKALDKLMANYSQKLNVVGMHVPFGDAFNASNPIFLKEMMESSWDNLVATEEFYDDMQQDLTFFKGVLAAPNGEMLEVDITPRELLDRMESGVY